MFLNLWHTSGRDDKVMADKPSSFMSMSPPRSPISPIAQIPLLNKMKRKYEDVDPVTPSAGISPAQKWAGTFSRVEIPTLNKSHHLNHSRPTASMKGDISANPPQTPARDRMDLHQVSEAAPQRSPETTNPAPGAQLVENSQHGEGATAIPKPHVSRTALRQAIETQFSLEILLKHKELRLIDQELGKCQIAMEQLRRCQIIPYPISSLVGQDVQHVLEGSGSAYNNTAPKAAPWGVTDGPYSRHLERWLLQDSAFDNSFVEPAMASATGRDLPDRSTRGNKSDKLPVSIAPRSNRGNNSRLQALPHGYPEVKEQKGPTIVKRASDGKMVKLVCNNCRRSDFNSVQGFINHCRIAHQQQFLSHDAAIEASGEEIDAEAEAEQDASGQRLGITSAGLVHPLIRTALLAKTTDIDTVKAPSKKSRATSNDGGDDTTVVSKTKTSKLPEAATQSPHTANQLFKPSPRTPRLSSLLARIGSMADLDALVNDAKTQPPIDLNQSSDDEEDEGAQMESTDDSEPKSRSTRGVVSSNHMPATTSAVPGSQIPGSQRGPVNNGRASEAPPRPAPLPTLPRQALYSSSFVVGHQDQDGLGQSPMDIGTPLNLSPNTTDPHPAPSLVSDDGDHETSHSDSEGPLSGDEDEGHHHHHHHYLDTAVLDHDEMDMGSEAGLGMDPAHNKHHHHHHHPEHHVQTPTHPIISRRSRHDRTSLSHGERHVSFAKSSKRF